MVILIAAILMIPTGCGKVSGDEPPADETGSVSVGNSAESPVQSQSGMINPLTGQVGSFDTGVNRQPVVVVVSNYRYSRWQSGISKAEVIIELPSESGQTQMLCFFSDIRDVGVIGPVDCVYSPAAGIIGGVNPFVVFNGYPAECSDIFFETGDQKAMNGDSDDSILYVDAERRTEYLLEYSFFSDGERIAAAADKRVANREEDGKAWLSFVLPEEGKFIPESGSARSITAIFSGIYDVDLHYDDEIAKYNKFQFLFSQTDKAANYEQLSFDNAFILFAEMKNAIDLNGVRGRLVEVDYSKGGEGYYFFGGRFEKIGWRLGEDGTLLSFVDSGGQQLAVNTGSTYIAVVNRQNEYTLKISG